MPRGYRVDLGGVILNSGDDINNSLVDFNTEEDLGAGSIDYQTGRWFVTNRTADGRYYIGTDGNVYFVPDNNLASGPRNLQVDSAPYVGVQDGTTGNDAITGSDTDDYIWDTTTTTSTTGTGNDSIITGAGNDTVVANDGNDYVDAGTGNDSVSTGTGNDTVDGGAGDDSISTGAGNDVVSSATGNDTVDLGSGDDLAYGGAGDDTILGGTGFDTIFGEGGNDTIDGGGDADTIVGGTGDDSILGNDGDDLIYGGNAAGTSLENNANPLELNIANIDTSTAVGNPDNATVGTSVVYNNVTTLDDGTPIMAKLVLADVDPNLAVDMNGQAGAEIILNGNNQAGSDGKEATFRLEFYNQLTGEPISISAVATFGDLDLDNGTERVSISDDTFSSYSVDASSNLTVTNTNGEITAAGTQQNAPTDQPAWFSGEFENQSYIEFTLTSRDSNSGFTLNGQELSNPVTTQLNGTTDNDIIDGGTGNDTIYGEGGDDSIAGGAGADSIIGGEGNDIIDGGSQNDTIDAGTGNDSINGGTGDDLISDGAGNDTVHAGDGNDSLINGEGNDSLYGDAGDDLFVAGLGDDYLDGGTGTDTIYGGDGEDTLVGGAGDDSLYGGEGNDSLQADAGNDIVQGGNGNDTISGGDGDDVLSGGTGTDTIYGDAGNDTISGDTGADVLNGGAGNDVINVADGDTATGGTGDDLFVLQDLGEPNGPINIDGSGGDETTGDTLQLGTLADWSTLNAVDDGTGSYSGSITLDDGTILTFNEIENIICFTPGTRIATPSGARAIETLKRGDLVVTRDHGLQPIRWIQSRTVPAIDRFAPVRLRKGVMVGQERDLLVSPQHRMLFQGYQAELLFGENEVLVSAKHLIDNCAVRQEEGGMVTYIHMMFDQHEVVFAEGAATESFHPGEVGLTAVSDEAREELFALFPELRAMPESYGDTARRCLKKHEALLLRA